MDWNPDESPLDPNPADSAGVRLGPGRNTEPATSTFAIQPPSCSSMRRPGNCATSPAISPTAGCSPASANSTAACPTQCASLARCPKELHTGPGNLIVGLRPGINGSGGDNRVYGMGSNGRSITSAATHSAIPTLGRPICAWARDSTWAKCASWSCWPRASTSSITRTSPRIETTGYSIERQPAEARSDSHAEFPHRAQNQFHEPASPLPPSASRSTSTPRISTASGRFKSACA